MGTGSETTAIVTGAGRGIGRSIAEELARRGAHVFVAEMDAARAEEAAGAIVQNGGVATPHPCDVTERAAVESLMAHAVDVTGSIDVLVNNAGIVRPAMLADMSDEQWGSVITTNLTSHFLTTQAAVRASMKERGGSIVNIASIVGLRGTIGQVNYAAAKAGVIGLTKASALELGRYGVRVNAIAPGTIETEMTQNILTRPEFRERYEREIVLGRFGQPQDVANAVAFLASSDSSWITGKVLTVDGGAYN